MGALQTERISIPRHPLFLSCLWQMNDCRLQAVWTENGQVLGEVRSAVGAGDLMGLSAVRRVRRYEETLDELIGELAKMLGRRLDGTPVAISGVASSQRGWEELPCAEAPFHLDGSGLNWKWMGQLDCETPGGGEDHAMLLVSGVRTKTDLMRGPETQILGLFAAALYGYGGEALLVLPGVYSKHVRIEEGAVTAFQTYLTGEVYELLMRQSVLAQAVRGDGEEEAREGKKEGHGEGFSLDAPEEHEAFLAGVRAGADGPLLHRLYRVRTRKLLDNAPAHTNAAYLGGLLIGSELDALRRGGAATAPLFVCCEGTMAALYHEACAVLRLSNHSVPPRAMETATALGHRVFLARHVAGWGRE